MDILYMLLVFPLETMIQLSYLLIWRIFENPALALIGVSAVVSTLTLPLYFMAEQHQQAERDTQRRLAPAAGVIKAVFRGDERYMMLSTWYRQNHYHPVYALRSSISLIIQVPFFIAAYHFITRLEGIGGTAFLFIKDLGLPDGMFHAGTVPVNILPILMTLINIVSGAVYTKGFPLKDKIQLYGMAGIFLVLLYNSPAGLVLYWTCNNLYGLVKNLVQRHPWAKRILLAGLAAAALALAAFVLFVHTGALGKRLVIAGAALLPLGAPLFRKIAPGLRQRIGPRINLETTALVQRRTFLCSLLALCLLAGLVIPSGLIASSVGEFAFIEPFASPLPFTGITLLESAGMFLWGACMYFLFDRRVRAAFALIVTLALGVSALNAFAFGGDYGFLTTHLRLSNFTDPAWKMTALNILAAAAVCGGIAVLLCVKKRNILFSLQNITLAAFLVFGILNAVKINRNFQLIKTPDKVPVSNIESVYTLSRTGKNVLVVMLDRGISGYVPYIFGEKPELLSSYRGFTFYPNSVSFGGCTYFGAPGIFGGYEYTPLEIQKRKNETLTGKYREAMAMLPLVIADGGFDVTVSDQPWMDENMRIHAAIQFKNIRGDYSHLYLRKNPQLRLVDYNRILRANLVRFSFFKFTPPFFRRFVYDHGKYLSSFTANVYSVPTMDTYTSLLYLPEITRITEDGKNYAVLMSSELTHDPAFFEAPGYEPAAEITDRGPGPFAGEDHYHANMAALLLLAKWFDFMKENGVYDNTRIIIVSDHGHNNIGPFPNSVILPNGENLGPYNALLLVKDFDADFALQTDTVFMTNADVPLLAVGGLIPDPVNPFTGRPLSAAKDGGVIVSTSRLWEPEKHFKNTYNVKPDQWLRVRDDIFDPANWSRPVVTD